MDGDFDLELNEIRRAVTDAEVLSILFPLVRKSLIIDARCGVGEGPMVRLVPQAGSREKRYRSLRRMRPRFPRPDNFVAVPWSRYVGSLEQSGAVEWIRRRLERSGYVRPLHALGAAIEEVCRLERLELVSAVLGERYHTIWASRK